MKLMEPRSVIVGENTYYIRPIPAMKAANMSAELAALAAPLLAGLAPIMAMADGKKEDGSSKGLFDIEVTDAAPAIGEAFSSLSGDKLELLLRHLLITGGNISVEIPGQRVQPLSEDLLNEIFCMDVQDMFILAFEVIRTNYNGFFEKLGGRFGRVVGDLMKMATPSQQNMANLT